MWLRYSLLLSCRLSDHAEDKTKLPILIFPEGELLKSGVHSLPIRCPNKPSARASGLRMWAAGVGWRSCLWKCSGRQVFHQSSCFSGLSSGTCINNTSVMMFKKGSFEIDATVYPVAIKVRPICWPGPPCQQRCPLRIPCSPDPPFFAMQYDPRFAEAFWNSSKFGMVNYLLRMMSSWAVVCSVWYLPPMHKEVGHLSASLPSAITPPSPLA